MVGKDALWKGIIEDLADEFIRYFFSPYIESIDFEKGFIFLDKELEKLFPMSASQRRHADKLIKAFLKDGTEQWFLIHVEVQGYPDPDFAKRMFQYAYRIVDRYGRPLSALAIYTDTHRAYHFSGYRETFFGTELHYRFQTFILMDHEPEALRRSENIFGLVLEAARRELDLSGEGDEQRLYIKTELVRHLFKQGLTKAKIRHLLDFISYYIRFDGEEYFHKFEEEIQLLTKSTKEMGIREAILQEMKEEGLKEGLKEGLEKGHEKGLEEGLEKGLEKGRVEGIEEKERLVISRAWKKGMPVAEIAELVALSVEKVETIIIELTETGG